MPLKSNELQKGVKLRIDGRREPVILDKFFEGDVSNYWEDIDGATWTVHWLLVHADHYDQPNTPSSPEALTNERKSTHGDWDTQSLLFDALLIRLTAAPGWYNLNHMQRAALINITQKMSRIVCGNPDEPDHWDDIAGYAFLGKGGHKQ